MRPPLCKRHNIPMRPSRYTGGWYCPRKIDGEWCDGTNDPPRYRCEECGATLRRPYCSLCRDPEMIVEVRTGRQEPVIGQDGLSEDHYGHG
jgi:hypothetical protein